MKLIDEKLGGTTPLEVILKFPEKKKLENDNEDEFEDWGDEEVLPFHQGSQLGQPTKGK